MEMIEFVPRSGGSSGTPSAGIVPSTGGGPGNQTGGGRMAVIGVTRNVRLRRRGASGFGFSLRGGREYAAGFYVSDVQPGSEAHRNGLRVNSCSTVAVNPTTNRFVRYALTDTNRFSDCERDCALCSTSSVASPFLFSFRFTLSVLFFFSTAGRWSDYKGERVSGGGCGPSGSRASGEESTSSRP